MSSIVSNEELDNARHEIEFCFDQFLELEPLMHQIIEVRTESKTLFDLYKNKVETEQSNGRLEQIMMMTILAQYRYIKLLEKSIGK